jgi:DNA-binding NarL/FixJ family response regulator
MIRVLVVDDHEIVRRGLIELLNGYDGLEVVTQVGSLEEGLAFSDFSSIDVALLDVRLADGSGIELCRHFHQEAPGLHCIMLTSYADDDALLASVLAGARGFVLKDINSDALVSAIRSVAAGNELMSSEFAVKVDAVIPPDVIKEFSK